MCCGAPFHVGQTVEWLRRDVDDLPRLTGLLGAELAESVTDIETHHFRDEERPASLSGEVLTIRAVFAAGEHAASFAERVTGDAAEYSTEQARGQKFQGYLVALRS